MADLASRWEKVKCLWLLYSYSEWEWTRVTWLWALIEESNKSKLHVWIQFSLLFRARFKIHSIWWMFKLSSLISRPHKLEISLKFADNILAKFSSATHIMSRDPWTVPRSSLFAMLLFQGASLLPNSGPFFSIKTFLLSPSVNNPPTLYAFEKCMRVRETGTGTSRVLVNKSSRPGVLAAELVFKFFILIYFHDTGKNFSPVCLRFKVNKRNSRTLINF